MEKSTVYFTDFRCPVGTSQLDKLKKLCVADGNDMEQLAAAFKEARETKGMPSAIIMKTVKGKGVSFMENQASWHGVAPNDEQYAVAMADLEKVGEALCQK